MPEAVNHPDHYNQHPAGIECIDVVEEFSFNVGNAISAEFKGSKNEDLKKAIWYIEREIKRRAL